MKTYIDNRVMRKAELITEENQITFSWASLLKYLDMEPLFENFPVFDEENDLFAFMISAIAKDEEEELIIRLYDQVFVECLTHVKAIPQIHLEFILDKIQKNKSLFFLEKYERLLMESPYEAIHGLILYLAWDRVCVNLTKIFEYVFPDLKKREGLETLKKCLVESFLHITGQGKSRPSFFKLMEALYAYQMREENLQAHTEEEWLVLCQGLGVLSHGGDLSDVVYIDAALGKSVEPVKIVTLDPAEEVKIGLSLGRCLVDKLKKEFLEWQYDFAPLEIVCLKENTGTFLVDEILHRQ